MNAMTLSDAIVIAQRFLDEHSSRFRVAYELNLDRSTEIPEGWLFRYSPKQEVPGPRPRIRSGAPIFVSRKGTAHQLPTGLPVGEAIKDLRG